MFKKMSFFTVNLLGLVFFLIKLPSFVYYFLLETKYKKASSREKLFLMGSQDLVS